MAGSSSPTRNPATMPSRRSWTSRLAIVIVIVVALAWSLVGGRADAAQVQNLKRWATVFCAAWSSMRDEAYSAVRLPRSPRDAAEAAGAREGFEAALQAIETTARLGAGDGVPNVKNGKQMAPLFESYFRAVLEFVKNAQPLLQGIEQDLAAFPGRADQLAGIIGQINGPIPQVDKAWNKAYKLDTSHRLYKAFAANDDCQNAGGFGR
ncbi:MAG TPA: hypothetical protein VGA62_10845 [Acidimicrobiia bacterium]